MEKKDVFELNFSISILSSSGSLQRLFCRLILLVIVVALVSEPLVGVVGVGIPYDGDVPKGGRLRAGVVGIEIGDGASEEVPLFRYIQVAGSSPTFSRTWSRSGFRWDAECWSW